MRILQINPVSISNRNPNLSAEVTIKRSNLHFDHKASLEDGTDILFVTDIGMTLSMPFEVKEGAKIKISSTLFEKVEISDPYLKVRRIQPDPRSAGKYLVEATFIFESNETAKKLRKWLHDPN